MNREQDTAYKTLKGVRKSKTGRNILVPEAKNALDSFKVQVASDLGINFSQADKGSFTSKDCGKVGGEMVRRIINQMKQEMINSTQNNRYQ
ncbi:MAG: Small, acid-soluble spore protein alpha/beta type [Clostridia bacterium]|nr:Small, acid-soluble spore protein alpha/beta type [Clostridia bacterium]